MIRLCSSSWMWKLFKRSARFLESNSAAEFSSTKRLFSRNAVMRGRYRRYYSTLSCCSVELCLSSLNYLFISPTVVEVKCSPFSVISTQINKITSHLTQNWVCDANTQLKNEKIRPSRGCKKKLKTYIIKNWSTYFLMLELICTVMMTYKKRLFF